MLQPFEDELRDWDEHVQKLSSGAVMARIRLRFTRWMLRSRARLRAQQGAPDEARQLLERAERVTELLSG